MRDGYLRGSIPRTPTARQIDVLAAYVAAGGSVADAAEVMSIRPSTAKLAHSVMFSSAMTWIILTSSRSRMIRSISAQRHAEPPSPVRCLLVAALEGLDGVAEDRNRGGYTTVLGSHAKERRADVGTPHVHIEP
jgi:hypothetical protein